MKDYTSIYTNAVVQQRMKEHRELERARVSPDRPQIFIPFKDYLLYEKGVSDMSAVQRRILQRYYEDYIFHCLILRMEYQHPNNFREYGLEDTVMGRR